MITNVYMLERRDGEGYMKSNQRHVNRLIEAGQAEWAGSDPDEPNNAVIHYADRIQP